tara:strand:+ start:691 stop:924 length:234 start_codon:yes stop_codon:yes gene_type:complete
MGDERPKPVGGKEYFNLLAEKLRAASDQICAACEIDLPPDAVPPTDRCAPVDCAAKRILRAADDVDRDIEKEDGSAA